MAFLTIINYIAMGIGYFVFILVSLFFLWLLIDTIKDKQQRKRWEKERADKEKVKETLANENVEQDVAKPTASNPDENNADQNKEKLVDETGKIKITN